MVKFQLDDAHPKYRDKIEGILTGLLARYPSVNLKSVSLFNPLKDDKSLGNSNNPGEIRLNSFWFSKDPSLLENAALEDVMVNINGRDIAWHGLLVQEPEHVLTHEFGHLLSDVVSNWDKWVEPRWQASIIDPQLAPSAYALSDLDEFWAETFALVELGLASKSQTDEFHRLIDQI